MQPRWPPEPCCSLISQEGLSRGSLARVPRSRGTCPRSRYRGSRPAGPQPDCASRRALALHQHCPGDASGHLEEGRRLLAGSDRAGVGWGRVSTCCGSAERSRLAPRRDGRGPRRDRGRSEPGCRGARAPSSAPRLPASVSRPEAAWEGTSSTSKGLRFRPRGPGRTPGGVGGLRGVPARRQQGWAAWGGCRGLRAADKAAAPPRSAGQWNEWAINSGQWAARVAPLKSRGSAEPRLFACAAPGAAHGRRAPAPPGHPVSGPEDGRRPPGRWGGGAAAHEGACGPQSPAHRGPPPAARAGGAWGPGRCGNALRELRTPLTLAASQGDQEPGQRGPARPARPRGARCAGSSLTPESPRSSPPPPPPCPSPTATTR